MSVYWVPLSGATGQVTYGATPPASPNDGDTWILPADTTNGIMWVFRYRAASASAYKWEFVGGAPTYQRIDTDQGTASATPVDLATVGPQFTLPRAGDYTCRFGAEVYNNTTAGSEFTALMRAAVTVVAPIYGTGVANLPGVMSHEAVAAGAAASDVVKLQYWVNSGTGNWRKRWLSVQPVRVS
jgi:hypothetical protein